ncbi:hypothetical protein T07_3507 [Trichinella nelsoni]|uniref:Uncharacterized protein n=1 Tax=Trichinella nelsoni TaxID=6336 RepID=A0A0V0RUZ4_9BILA|nr:hypothetical protein T07_3507 [Trichinella nelsoni]
MQMDKHQQQRYFIPTLLLHRVSCLFFDKSKFEHKYASVLCFLLPLLQQKKETNFFWSNVNQL